MRPHRHSLRRRGSCCCCRETPGSAVPCSGSATIARRSSSASWRTGCRLQLFGVWGLDTAASLLQIDNLSSNDAHIQEKFQPNGIIIDSDTRGGVQTAFERIASAKRQFPTVPVIALGNEMSAQLVLAAAGAEPSTVGE